MINLFIIFLGILGLGIGQFSHTAEAASNLVVQINGTNIVGSSPCSSTTEVVLSNCDGTVRTYAEAGIKIEGVSGKIAKVTTTDGNEDKLKLVDSKITATQAQSINCNANDDTKYMNCTTIFFSGLFEKGPDGTNADVSYYRESIGSTMKRNANPASGSSFRINGWVNDLNNPGDVQIGYVQKKIICATPASCADVNFGQTGVMLHPSLPDQRELKVQIWFGLKYTNDVLTIQSAHVSSTAGGGGVGKGAVIILNDPEEGSDGRVHSGGKDSK